MHLPTHLPMRGTNSIWTYYDNCCNWNYLIFEIIVIIPGNIWSTWCSIQYTFNRALLFLKGNMILTDAYYGPIILATMIKIRGQNTTSKESTANSSHPHPSSTTNERGPRSMLVRICLAFAICSKYTRSPVDLVVLLSLVTRLENFRSTLLWWK